MHYIQTSFNFGCIPYEMGIRHIHTPEHFASSHPLTLPWFHIEKVNKFIAVDRLHIVSLTCSMLLWGCFSVHMMSDERTTSRLVLSKASNVMAVMECHVTPCAKGHTLHISGFHSLMPNWLMGLFLRVMMWEDRWLWSHATTQLPNMVLYRRAVMFPLKIGR
jgi:hypothetical protein